MLSELSAILVLFGAAVVAAWLLRFLKLPAMLGFLIAGIVLGPTLRLVHPDQIHFFAELGLVMLLFAIGLELSPEPLLRVGGRLLVATGLQMGLTAIATAAAMRYGFGLDWVACSVVGLAAGASSTAIVLVQLSQRGEVDSPAGTLATGILLLQDVVVIFAMALLPIAASLAGVGADAGTEGGKADGITRTLLTLAALGAIVGVGRFVVPMVTNLLFRTGGREWMTLFAVLMAVFGAWMADLADWSWALGACIAGLLLAQTDLRHQLHAEITPFRDVFNALFFISIGMLVDFGVLAEHWLPLSLLIVGTLLAKTVFTAIAALAGGWSLRLSLVTGIGLCTISEFSYVLGKEARQVGILPAEFMPLLVAWTVGTMLLGSLLIPIASPLADALVRRLLRAHASSDEQAHGVHGLDQHVIVVGFGVNGLNIARALRATAIPHVVIEMNRARLSDAALHGVRVVVGDAVRLPILESAGIAGARAMVVAIADSYATRRIVAQARTARRDLYIVARTRYVAEMEALKRAGADLVIPEEFETSIEIFSHLLRSFAIPDNVIAQQVAIVRAGQYAMLRGSSIESIPRSELMRALEQTATQTFVLLDEHRAAGRTIRELDFRKRTGVTIAAITHAGKPMANPDADTRITVGDVLVLVGGHRQLDDARRLLESGE
ncbi:MAG: cation:proton antiporter [Phycisphaerae bacterium]